MKKYTVFFSSDVQRVLSADPECYGQFLYRNYRTANLFPSSLIELMLTKPNLDSEEKHSFLPIWKGLYRQWETVKAAYDRAGRGTVYVSLPGDDGYFTRLNLKFGKLSIIFVMFNSGKPAGWVTRVGDVIIDDQRIAWTDEQRSWFDPD